DLDLALGREIAYVRAALIDGHFRVGSKEPVVAALRHEVSRIALVVDVERRLQVDGRSTILEVRGELEVPPGRRRRGRVEFAADVMAEKIEVKCRRRRRRRLPFEANARQCDGAADEQADAQVA